jgi:hypothetical protein
MQPPFYFRLRDQTRLSHCFSPLFALGELLLDSRLYSFPSLLKTETPPSDRLLVDNMLQDGWTNLHYAAAGGNVDQVSRLIFAKAAVEAQNKVHVFKNVLGGGYLSTEISR